MKYIINNFLYYDAVDATLSLHDNGISDTHLSITANALLYFLLQHDSIITRDEIMKRVWDDNGLTSSNGNLNQYLSLLRKSFRNYQIENIIITIARGRLEINKDICIEIIDNNKLHPLFFNQEKQLDKNIKTKNNDYKLDVDQVVIDKGQRQERNWMIACAVLFTAALILLWTAIVSEHSINVVKLNQVSAGICELFSNENMINSEMSKSYRNSFNVVREKLNLECNEDRRFVFYYSDKFKNKGLGRTFMAHCAKNENNPYAYCDNYFYYSWK